MSTPNSISLDGTLEEIFESADNYRQQHPNFAMSHPDRIFEQLKPKLDFLLVESTSREGVWKEINVTEQISGSPQPKEYVTAYVRKFQWKTEVAFFDANNLNFVAFYIQQPSTEKELGILIQSLARTMPKYYDPSKEGRPFTLFEVPEQLYLTHKIKYGLIGTNVLLVAAACGLVTIGLFVPEIIRISNPNAVKEFIYMSIATVYALGSAVTGYLGGLNYFNQKVKPKVHLNLFEQVKNIQSSSIWPWENFIKYSHDIADLSTAKSAIKSVSHY